MNGCLEFIRAALPPELWMEFGSQKKFWGVGVFFILGEGGGSPYGGLPKKVVKWGDSTLKTWIVYFFFLFLNSARLYSCVILIVLSYVCITI